MRPFNSSSSTDAAKGAPSWPQPAGGFLRIPPPAGTMPLPVSWRVTPAGETASSLPRNGVPRRVEMPWPANMPEEHCAAPTKRRLATGAPEPPPKPSMARPPHSMPPKIDLMPPLPPSPPPQASPEDRLQFNELSPSGQQGGRWTCHTPPNQPPAWLHGVPHTSGEHHYAFGFDDPTRSTVVYVRLKKVNDFRSRHPEQDQRALMTELLARARRKSSLRQWFDLASRKRKTTQTWVLDKQAARPQWHRVPLATLPDEAMQHMREVGEDRPFSPPPVPMWKWEPAAPGTAPAGLPPADRPDVPPPLRRKALASR